MFDDGRGCEQAAGGAGGVAGGALDGLSDSELLEVAVAVLRRLAAAPLTAAITDQALTASLAVLQRLATMAEAEKLRRVAEIDARAVHTGHSRSPADLLGDTCGLSRGEALRQHGLADALTQLPATAGALADGQINLAQAREAARSLTHLQDAAAAGGLTLQQLDQAAGQVDQTAADHIRSRDLRGLRRDLDDLAARAGSGHLAARERRAHTRRYLWFGPADGAEEGMTRLDGLLDAVTAAKLHTALTPLARPAGPDDSRTIGQRRHDALAQLCNLATDTAGIGGGAGGGGGGAGGGGVAETRPETAVPRAQVLLVTTPDALHNQPDVPASVLDGYGPVSSETARQVCCHAELTPVTVDRNGTILDVGRSLRFPTTAQRRAVIARDRTCVGCGAPALACQVHHITWWDAGGRTDLANLTLLCPSCHTNVHHFGWQITSTPQGRYTAHPPNRGPADPTYPDTGQRRRRNRWPPVMRLGAASAARRVPAARSAG